jgi:two-component system, LytTR family, response regulator
MQMMNKTIKCIIIDDEENCRIALRELIKQFHKQVVVEAEYGNANIAYSDIMEQNVTPDIVFLDIQMPECDGFAFLQKFEHIKFYVIFTTAFDHYAIKAIKFSALDYLTKPIDNEDLADSFQRYLELDSQKIIVSEHFKQASIAGKLFDKLAIPSINEINFLPIKDIVYLESDNNYTAIYSINGDRIVSSKNIGYYEELLDDLPFFRIHNSFIINLKKVKKYIKGKPGLIEMENGVKINVSLRRKDDFLDMLSLM